MIRLIASDMDGTLLNGPAGMPPETIELINELDELGVRFCVGSGRRLPSLRELFAPVADKINYVASNGMEVAVGNELISVETFSRSDLMRLAEVVNQFDYAHLTCGVHGKTYCFDEDPAKYERFLEVHGSWTTYTQGAPAVDEDIVLGVVVCSDPDQIVDLSYLLNLEMGDVFLFQRTGQVAIDFTPRRITKSAGLHKVLAYHGIKPQDVVVYGDAMNDYDMMRLAGHPVCVGNALYGISQISERIIEPNTEHGVQRDMARIIADIRAGGTGEIDFRAESTMIGRGAGVATDPGTKNN